MGNIKIWRALLIEASWSAVVVATAPRSVVDKLYLQEDLETCSIIVWHAIAQSRSMALEFRSLLRTNSSHVMRLQLPGARSAKDDQGGGGSWPTVSQMAS